MQITGNYIPNADISRIDWGSFGHNIEATFTWIVNLFSYFSKLLFSVPIGSPLGIFGDATYGGLLCYFLFLYAIIKFFLSGYFTLGAIGLGSKKDFGERLR